LSQGYDSAGNYVPLFCDAATSGATATSSAAPMTAAATSASSSATASVTASRSATASATTGALPRYCIPALADDADPSEKAVYWLLKNFPKRDANLDAILDTALAITAAANCTDYFREIMALLSYVEQRVAEIDTAARAAKLVLVLNALSDRHYAGAPSSQAPDAGAFGYPVFDPSNFHGVDLYDLLDKAAAAESPDAVDLAWALIGRASKPADTSTASPAATSTASVAPTSPETSAASPASSEVAAPTAAVSEGGSVNPTAVGSASGTPTASGSATATASALDSTSSPIAVKLLSLQLDSGAFAAGGTTDALATGMAIQALRRYSDWTTTIALSKAVRWALASQNTDGSWSGADQVAATTLMAMGVVDLHYRSWPSTTDIPQGVSSTAVKHHCYVLEDWDADKGYCTDTVNVWASLEDAESWLGGQQGRGGGFGSVFGTAMASLYWRDSGTDRFDDLGTPGVCSASNPQIDLDEGYDANGDYHPLLCADQPAATASPTNSAGPSATTTATASPTSASPTVSGSPSASTDATPATPSAGEASSSPTLVSATGETTPTTTGDATSTAAATDVTPAASASGSPSATTTPSPADSASATPSASAAASAASSTQTIWPLTPVYYTQRYCIPAPTSTSTAVERARYALFSNFPKHDDDPDEILETAMALLGSQNCTWYFREVMALVGYLNKRAPEVFTGNPVRAAKMLVVLDAISGMGWVQRTWPQYPTCGGDWAMDVAPTYTRGYSARVGSSRLFAERLGLDSDATPSPSPAATPSTATPSPTTGVSPSASGVTPSASATPTAASPSTTVASASPSTPTPLPRATVTATDSIVDTTDESDPAHGAPDEVLHFRYPELSATNFGGVDLAAAVKAGVGKDGKVAGQASAETVAWTIIGYWEVAQLVDSSDDDAYVAPATQFDDGLPAALAAQLLSFQLADGSFKGSSGASDASATGIAVQAASLLNYYSALKAWGKALDWAVGAQRADGSWEGSVVGTAALTSALEHSGQRWSRYVTWLDTDADGWVDTGYHTSGKADPEVRFSDPGWYSWDLQPVEWRDGCLVDYDEDDEDDYPIVMCKTKTLSKVTAPTLAAVDDERCWVYEDGSMFCDTAYAAPKQFTDADRCWVRTNGDVYCLDDADTIDVMEEHDIDPSDYFMSDDVTVCDEDGDCVATEEVAAEDDADDEDADECDADDEDCDADDADEDADECDADDEDCDADDADEDADECEADDEDCEAGDEATEVIEIEDSLWRSETRLGTTPVVTDDDDDAVATVCISWEGYVNFSCYSALSDSQELAAKYLAAQQKSDGGFGNRLTTAKAVLGLAEKAYIDVPDIADTCVTTQELSADAAPYASALVGAADAGRSKFLIRGYKSSTGADVAASQTGLALAAAMLGFVSAGLALAARRVRVRVRCGWADRLWRRERG
jgi:hypothetical protein